VCRDEDVLGKPASASSQALSTTSAMMWWAIRGWCHARALPHRVESRRTLKLDSL